MNISCTYFSTFSRKELLSKAGIHCLLLRILLFVLFTALQCGVAQAQAPPPKAILSGRLPEKDLRDIGLRISPTIVHTRTPPGLKSDIVLHFETPGNARDMRADFKLLSFTVAEDGWPYQIVNGHSHDAITWFNSKVDPVIIRRGEKKDVKLHYKVPSTARGYYWVALLVNISYVQGVDFNSFIGQINLPVAYHCYIPIFIGTTTTRPATLDLSPLECRRQSPKGRNYSLEVLIANDTEGFSELEMLIEVQDAISGRRVFTDTQTGKLVLPRSRRRHATQLPVLPDGKYKATMRIIQDGHIVPSRRLNFEVINNAIKPGDKTEVTKLAPILFRPETLELNMKPGNFSSSVVRIANNSDHPISLKLVACGVSQQRDGLYDTDPDIAPSNLKFTVLPQTLDIPVGTERNVRLTVETNRQAKGDIWFGLRAREIDGANTHPQSMIGHVVAGKEAAPVLELDHPRLDMVNNYPTTFHFVVRNRGNLAIIPFMSAFISNRRATNRTVVLTVPDWHGLGILPGFELDNQVAIPPKLPPGEYTLRLDAQFNNIGPTLLQNFTVKAVPSVPKHSPPASSANATKKPGKLDTKQDRKQ